MLEDFRSELADLQELYAVQERRTADVLHVLLRDLGDMGTDICVHETKMVYEDGASLDDEFSVVRLFITNLKSELKSLVNQTRHLESTREHTSSRIQASERELACCHILISQFQVKIRSLTECVQKAEESKGAPEVSRRTLAQDSTQLQARESKQDLREVEEPKELLRRNHPQQSRCVFSEGPRETQSKMMLRLGEEFNKKQKILSELKGLNEDLVLEQKRLQCEKETLIMQEEEKEIKLQELIESNGKTGHISHELRDFEETLARQLRTLRDLRKMFVQDLTTRVKKSAAAGCGGSAAMENHKISFLENNLEQLTRAHKQLVLENAELRCELPKLEKRLRGMSERAKALECTLREAKQRASRERGRYQQEVERIKDAIRAKNTAWRGHAALIAKPIRSGHHHTFSASAGGGGRTVYSYHHV